ncbi:MAG: hypothetical protein N2Z65_08210, partial [Clostridiales bacterium]|nr:hypothetical protein [Clostridiales bacterium]
MKSVAEYLPPALKNAVYGLSYDTQAAITELRLRTGRSFSALISDREIPVLGRDQKGISIIQADILYVLD